ncbi:MAG TPA: pentapeptide repeat-containing protein [Nostocaceae cyanobacterium]|nr:pentapeptide repeat-containing protein [Nostocaceae cyanobacterium]
MNHNFASTWQKLRQSFSISTNPKTKFETGKAVLVAAKVIKEQNKILENLQLLLQYSSSLLDLFCLPLVPVIPEKLSFLSLGTSLLKFYPENSQQKLTLEDHIFILTQAAYLESCQEILSLYPAVNWDSKAQIMQIITQLLSRFQNFQLDQQTAIKTISCFHQSELATAFNQILFTRLTGANISKANAYILTQRIAGNTQHHIINAWLELGSISQNLLPDYFQSCQQAQQKFYSIDEYLKIDIATKPLENILDDHVTFKDVYLSPQIKLVKENGKIDHQSPIFDLETWVKGIILKPDNLEKVIFIQGASGRGKSIFCRMFADWVYQHLHPIWTPILISLKDINSLSPQLETTLQSQLQYSFAQNQPNWLQDQNTRFLFILDGWNELKSTNNNSIVEAFIQQVAIFQKTCHQNSAMGHRLLVTGCSSSLKDITQLPQNLERVEIIEMDEQLQTKWLQQWKLLPIHQNKETDLQQILQNSQLPLEVQQLAKEPLILHLLASIYRDNKLTIDKLLNSSNQTAKTIIYQEAINWLITKQNYQLNNQISEQKPETLKRLLTEAAVCVIQSGGKSSSISTLEARLEEEEECQKIIQQIKQTISQTNQQKYFTILDIQCTKNHEIFIKFFHPSFRDFLFAEKLKTCLKTWTQYYETEEGKQLIVPTDQMHWQIYDLLGFGQLTIEIVQYLMGLIIEISDFNWLLLFKRLENFYHHWHQGKFIDSATETLAQKKLCQLQKYGIKELGQRQVDIYAGLNVMILLLEIHRYFQDRNDLKRKLMFHPAGRNTEETLTNQLLKIINYSNSIQVETFNDFVGQFLNNAHLSQVNIRGAKLDFANFSHAFLGDSSLSSSELAHATFENAYLGGANLSYSDLEAAKLQYANLNGANLSHSNLNHADLSHAFLIDAKLFDANLNSANLSYANLRGAKLSGADLIKTNCHCANLSNANLRGAELSEANLTYTKLNSANLTGANLHNANLSNADLRSVNISRANFANANLENIIWNKEIDFTQVQGLDTAINLPEDLKQHLNL